MKKITIILIFYIFSAIFTFSYLANRSNSSLLLPRTTFSSVPKKTLLFVPLDDRPSSTYFVQKMANFSDVSLIIPPDTMLGKFGEPANTNRIQEWIDEQSPRADAFVLAIPMIAYGGLVASRTDNKTYEEAEKAIHIIETLKTKYPNKKIYAYDIIQRLTITVFSSNDLKNYQDIRNWSELYDEVYNQNKISKKEDLEALQSEIPSSMITDYLAARERNFKVNNLLIDLAHQNVIDFLVLGQDDADINGFHRPEQIALQQKISDYNLNNNVFICSATDEIGELLLSKFVVDNTKNSPLVYVKYFGDYDKSWVAPYDSSPFYLTVQQQIKVSGGVETSDIEKANMILLINEPKSEAYESSLVQFLNQHESSFVSFIDLEDPSNPSSYIQFLKNNLPISAHFSYSGWNTASNALGIGLSASILSYASQLQSTSTLDSRMINYFDFEFERLIEDASYFKVLRPQYDSTLPSHDIDPWHLGNNQAYVTQKLNSDLKKDITDWTKIFQSKLNPSYHLEYTNIIFPWGRTFELEFKPSFVLK